MRRVSSLAGWGFVAMGLGLGALAACASSELGDRESGAWAGTVTREGNVTTVINESGSLWGGPIEVVEDLSIGIESGDARYMLGRVNGIGATDDRIYVADAQLYAVRVYDSGGSHLFDFGRQGEGPGELDAVAQLAVDPAGRVFVQGNSRITVFDLDGNLLDTWPHRRAGVDQLLTIGADGTAYVPSSWTEDGERRSGFIAVSPDGSEVGKITGPIYDDARLTARGPDGSVRGYTRIPYSPRGHWTVLSSGATVEGPGDTYRFEVKYPERSLIIERPVAVPAVPPGERAWQVAQQTRVMRRMQPDWDWSGPPIPEHVPAYNVFIGDRHGRIWVMRTLGLEVVSDCDADPAIVEGRPARPCYEPVFGFDVFDEEDGRFLGQVRLPGWFRSPPLFVEDAILWAVEDEAGTIMVKRFRMVLADGSPLPVRKAQR